MNYFTDYTTKPVRAAAALTAAYVAGTTLTEEHLKNQMLIYAFFTIGSLTNAQIKVEFSADNVNWVQETFQSVTSGTATETPGVHLLGATGNYRIVVPVEDRFIRISSIGTGNAAGSSLAITAVIGIS